MPQRMSTYLALAAELLIAMLPAIGVFIAFEAVTGKSWGGAPIGAIAGVIAPLQFAPSMQALPPLRRRLISTASAFAGALAVIVVLSVIG